MKDFKYDVAFSFVQKDESLALGLYNLLNGRIKCFIYTEEQKRLAGTDGEKTFNSVFSKESRVVVVLFSQDWGKTKWTRIEETAIRNKGFDEGYDFVILVPTEKNVSPPKWLPKNRIWVGLERWDIESAASVIETRVIEFNRTIKEETIEDKVAKKDLELKETKRREQLLDSSEGLSLASNEIKQMKTEINKKVESIKTKVPDWHINIIDNNLKLCNVNSYGYHLTFQFHQFNFNSLQDSYLTIALLKGYFDKNGNATDSFSENKKIAHTRFQFDINQFNQNGWSIKDTRRDFKQTKALVNEWIEKLIDFASKNR